MKDERRPVRSAAATSQFTCPHCNASIGEPWPRCACGRRFPSAYHLERHLERTGCEGECEYRAVHVRRLQLPKPREDES